MSKQMPTLFVAHGAPTLALETTPAHRFLRTLGAELPRPRAIVVASAHWESPHPAVTGALAPDTIHDFHGFPPALYELRYPAPGDPALALRVAELLRSADWQATVDSARGLDHGAWVPLSLAWPDARIPVVQVSLLAGGDAAAHYRMGAALAPLRDDEVLVVGTGGITHNLRGFRGQPVDAEPPVEVVEFAEWVKDGLQAREHERLLGWEAQAPSAQYNHPTPEHLLPLFVALGAAGPDATATPLFRGYEFGVLAMDAWRFG